MLEAVENNGFLFNGGEESHSEEGLSVLPPHTKVVVTGNNRTKSVLVGLRGVVKKAVGLGGWHWLVLTNGIEVKLQRNALSVVEFPPISKEGEEEDDYNPYKCCEHLLWNDSDPDSDVTQKSYTPRYQLHRPGRSFRKARSRTFSGDSQSKSSFTSSPNSMNLDLSKLETRALLRYLKHFNLVDGIPNPSKQQLINEVQRHFIAQKLDEQQVISGFMKAAKRLKNSL